MLSKINYFGGRLKRLKSFELQYTKSKKFTKIKVTNNKGTYNLKQRVKCTDLLPKKG
jgi:hypothetical protein